MGLIGNKQFNDQESLWGYRYAQKGILNEFKFGPSAQICLFIGKLKSHNSPRHKQMLPIKYINIILSFKDLDLLKIR